MMFTRSNKVFNKFAVMQHVLDNPAWSALTSGNKHLANGSGQAKYFDTEVSPFIGLEKNSADNFGELFKILPYSGPVGFITPVQMDIPGNWKVLRVITALQMVFKGHMEQAGKNNAIIPLTDQHIPQMLTLTQLTKPGPFNSQTIRFGHYYGIFDGDQLVAMTGQRLHTLNYAEVSAVCTHPAYLGRGYAKMLLRFHINRIKTAGGIPFLHVRANNERAIQVYEHSGFAARKEIYFYFLQKA